MTKHRKVILLYFRNIVGLYVLHVVKGNVANGFCNEIKATPIESVDGE